jgi:hypothetical protein
MRVFSLIALALLALIIGLVTLRQPANRSALDQFAAYNVEAAISAANGTMIAAVIFMTARAVLYGIVGITLNLILARLRRVGALIGILLLKVALAWIVYLGLFTYAREVGFTRILWNLQDFGLNTDATAIVAISAITIGCIALLPDLLVGLLTNQHENAFIRFGRRRKLAEPDKDVE